MLLLLKDRLIELDIKIFTKLKYIRFQEISVRKEDANNFMSSAEIDLN